MRYRVTLTTSVLSPEGLTEEKAKTMLKFIEVILREALSNVPPQFEPSMVVRAEPVA